MALLIDTEGVHPRRRASHFLDAMMASPLPAHDASHSRFEAADFRVRFRMRPLGDAYMADFLASGLQLTRSRHEIDRQPGGQLLVALVTRGSCQEDLHRVTLFWSRSPTMSCSSTSTGRRSRLSTPSCRRPAPSSHADTSHFFRMARGCVRFSSGRVTNSMASSRPASSQARRRKA